MSALFKGNEKNKFVSQVVVLSAIFGFAAGVIGQLVVDGQLDPWRQYNLGNSNTNQTAAPRIPELQYTKRFLGIEQDFEVDKALRQNAVTTVGVYVKKNSPTSLQQVYVPADLLASGVLLTSDGWVITVSTAVEDNTANELAVVYQRQVFSVEQSVTDEVTGVTFLKITTNNLPVIIFGDAKENVLGQLAVTLNGLGEAVVSTITKPSFQSVTKPADLVRSSERYSDLILFEANLGPQYLGAPLLNLAGEVTGIISVIDEASEQVHAVPINQLRPVILTVLKSSSISRPYLGIRYLDITEAVGLAAELTQDQNRGALVYEAPPATSPAAQGGIQLNDIILTVDGQMVDQALTLTEIIQQHEAGDQITVVVLREGAQVTLSITLAALPE